MMFFPFAKTVFTISSLYTVGELSLCWTASSESWTGKHCWAFNMSVLVIRWNSFWKMLVMTAANHIHPLYAQWEGTERRKSFSQSGYTSSQQDIELLDDGQSFKWNFTHLKSASDSATEKGNKAVSGKLYIRNFHHTETMPFLLLKCCFDTVLTQWPSQSMVWKRKKQSEHKLCRWV